MKALAEWIETQAASIQFGAVNVSVKIKDGNIVRIEKVVMQSEHPQSKKAGSQNEKYRKITENK